MSGSHFAQIALCAVEHSSFKKFGGAKLLEGKVGVKSLLEADQAGAVIGANGRTLIREQMHKMLQVDAKGAPNVVAAAIAENATNDALQVLIRGMLDEFPNMICNVHQEEGKELVKRAIEMLDLGAANLAKRFLQAVQGVKEALSECFCNYILAEYVANGAQPILMSSLRKLYPSFFHPTRLFVIPGVWTKATTRDRRFILARITGVFNQFQPLPFLEIYEADPIPILKFLQQLPQSINITHLSSSKPLILDMG